MRLYLNGLDANEVAPTIKKSWMESLTDSVQQSIPALTTLANTALSIKSQKALNKLNVARASAGQPPIDIATYNEANAPVIKIKGGVDSGTSNNLMIGGGLVAVALLFIALKKGK